MKMTNTICFLSCVWIKVNRGKEREETQRDKGDRDK